MVRKLVDGEESSDQKEVKVDAAVAALAESLQQSCR